MCVGVDADKLNYIAILCFGWVGIVPSEPSAIKAVVSSLESVIVSWLPPKSPNGFLVKFNVYIRILGAGREIRTVKRSLPSHVFHYEVTDLKRRESYEVS